MRKMILIVLIILLVVMSGFTIVKGVTIGNFQILGVKAISEENKNIDQKKEELSDLVTKTYPNALAQLDTSSKTLTDTKEKYENKAVLGTNSQYYMQTEKYEMEFLWTKLGNYAKDENVEIKIDVTNSTTSGLYDLKFNVAGQYLDVSYFIYDIENDSKLGFKIEDFHMSAIEGGVQASFTCKELNINIESAETNTESKDESQNDNKDSANNTTNESATNTTNNTTTDNATANNTTNDTTTNTTTNSEANNTNTQ